MIYKGSEWRKWDLHVHTPKSIHQNYGEDTKKVWDDFIDSLEKLPEEIRVIGITDYYFIDGFEKVIEYKKKGRLSRFEKIFPILEFRIDTFSTATGSKFQKINLHILFDLDENNIDVEINQIKSEFIKQIPLTKLKKHKTKMLTKENIVSESSKGNLSNGFSELIPSTEKVFDQINTDTWKNKTFLFLGFNEWNDLEKGAQLKIFKEDLYSKVGAFFTASKKDFQIEKRKKILEIFGNKQILHSLDIHDFNSFKKYFCNTWIKADPTFEGLKQILYEPEYRVRIQENKPIEPIHRINNVIIDLPKEVKIINDRNDKEQEEEFCLCGKKIEIKFNPYFNCIIGGRGTGKSSILNLIQETLSPNSNDFYLKHPLKIEDNTINYAEHVIINDNEPIEVEFLSQNEIEKFALKSDKFTNSIFQRIKKRDTQKEIDNKNMDVDLYRGKLKSLIGSYKRKYDYVKELKNINNDIKINENILISFKEKEYIKFMDKIKENESEIQHIKESRNQLNKFIVDIDSILDEVFLPQSPEEDKNIYDIILSENYHKIHSIISGSKQKDYNEIDTKEKEINNDLNKVKLRLEKYLQEKGLSQENFKDISSAQQKVIKNKYKKEEIKKKEKIVDEYISDFNFKENIKKEYETIIKNKINDINDILNEVSEKSSPIQKISLEYTFDSKKMKEEFIQEILNRYQLKNISVKDLSIFIDVDNSDFFNNKESCLSIINGKRKYETKTASIISEIIRDGYNFDIIKLIYKRLHIDINRFMRINVYYGDKLIQNSSFGQRCTATIIILLCLGNKPLVIDEPEAHLDSSLIAEFLVNLVKDEKFKRQLIFATHNANFVINGDAELIHILDTDENNKTEITSTSIENFTNRKKLLKLEGGEEAFKQRQEKYHF